MTCGAGVSGLFVFAGRLTLVSGCLLGAEHHHALLLCRCLRVPLAFYDTTPAGRIINRISGDVFILDNLMEALLEDFLQCGGELMGTLVVISVSTPWFLCVAVPLALVYMAVQVVPAGGGCTQCHAPKPNSALPPYLTFCYVGTLCSFRWEY